MPHQGSCLCGQTIIVINTMPTNQFLCHCFDCRKSNGSAFSSNFLVPEAELKIDGPTKTFEIKAASGNDVTRWFCSNCGSQIYHRSACMGPLTAVHTGNFVEFAKLPISFELFVKDRWPGLPAVQNAMQFEDMLPIPAEPALRKP
ncbi:Mss4-like protein [Crucibulum laeve]|uniref:Mss4-like protein n=1 Tax=Crucibulum laeve TaxID=68775 RepID=A0A5C3LZ75_9AGAR|nr:Mss4-like protein [Crucibulum laeve]